MLSATTLPPPVCAGALESRWRPTKLASAARVVVPRVRPRAVLLGGLAPSRFAVKARPFTNLRSMFFLHLRPILFSLLGLCAGLARAAEPASALGRPATAEELAMLSNALERTAQDLRRWAYTESRVVKDEKGKVKTDVVVRFDPSKPYPDQWSPISVNGRQPTSSEQQKYRRQGERAQQREETGEGSGRPSLGESIDLRTASIALETADAWTFEVPLKKVANVRFPPEKFQVLVRIGKATRALEQIAVKLRASFRSKLIVKVKSGEGVLEFAAVNPKYPPTLISINGDASASVFFVSIGGLLELKRTDIKHVKPFDERFDVQIGTLRAIDF
ncbi:MAG: hypothetical protein RL077_2503 [Verrucomicrobiota bacterium]